MQESREVTKDIEIDLFGLLRILWNRRWLVAAITGLFTLAGVAYALLATEWYRAEVVVVQTDNKSTPSSLAQLGGLASLAGINIGAGGASQIPIAVLKSHDFAQAFIEDERLLTVLFADDWDDAGARWKTGNSKESPDIRDAVKFFDEKDSRSYGGQKDRHDYLVNNMEGSSR